MKKATKKKTKKKDMTVYEKFKNTDSSVKSTFFTALLFMFIIVGVGITQLFGISYAADGPLLAQELPATLTSKTELAPRSNYIDGVGGENGLVRRFYAQDGSGNIYNVFCLDRWKKQLADVTYTKQGSPVEDKGLAYLLTQIYPVSSDFMSNKDMYERLYISQLTIWFYQDRKAGYSDDVDECDTSKGNINSGQCVENGKEMEEDPDHYWKNQLLASEKALIKDSSYWSIMEPVINAALNYTEDTNYGLSINQDTLSCHLSEDGKYIESNFIAPTHTGSNFTGYSFTSESSDITFYDETGAKIEQGTTLVDGKKFQFRVPVEKLKEEKTLSLNVKFTGTFTQHLAYIYDPNDGAYQKILIGAIQLTPKNTEFTLNLEIPMGSVKISKVDATTGEELEGATLVVTNKQTGEVIDKWVSTKEIHYIDPIPAGTYILTETIHPEGYQEKTTSVEFTVEKGKVTEVEMENVPETPVPDTGSIIPPYLYIIGAMAFVIGVGLILVAVKQPRHE